MPADRSATDVLAQAGIGIDTKCSDGLCGVCSTPYDASASGVRKARQTHRTFACA